MTPAPSHKSLPEDCSLTRLEGVRLATIRPLIQRIALCLSCRGIRNATFGLEVLQELAKLKLLVILFVDYPKTYTGTRGPVFVF